MEAWQLLVLYNILSSLTNGEELWWGNFDPEKNESDREKLEILNALEEEITKKIMEEE